MRRPMTGVGHDTDREVTVGLRLEAINGGHATVGVFVGLQLPAQRGRGGRGKAGTLTLRVEEWTRIRDLLERGLEVEMDVVEPLVDDDGTDKQWVSDWKRGVARDPSEEE